RYPKPSHSFIRREIAALERHGWQVERIALRGWDEPPLDPEDALEEQRTRYVLREGLAPLAAAAAAALLRAPARFLAALGLAVRIAWLAVRGLVHDLAFPADAGRAPVVRR